MTPRKQTKKSSDNYHRFMQEFLTNHICLPDILLDQYQQLKLSELELVQLIRFVKRSKDWSKFTLENVMDEFEINNIAAEEIIMPFLEKGLVYDVEGAEGKYYSFDGLFKELSEAWFYAKSSQNKSKPQLSLTKSINKTSTDNQLGKLYQAFEKEFGRGLSPMENDKFSQWLEIDKISTEVILEALRRAVLQGKTTFNYIDRILINWQKQNLHTVSQIMEKDRYPNTTMVKQPKKSTASVKSPYNSIYNKF